jgi:hypothetical protein
MSGKRDVDIEIFQNLEKAPKEWMPAAGVPGLPEAGAEDSRLGCLLQGDRAVIDDGQTAVEKHGFIVH